MLRVVQVLLDGGDAGAGHDDREGEAAEPLGITYLAHDLVEELPFGDGEFDVAVSVMAIMDVEDPLAALRNIGRVVRPGGLLAFSILHPCFYRPRLNAHRTGVDVGHYFDRDRVEGRYIEAGDGTRAEYRQFHRTLGDYLNTVADAGFLLARLVEPGDTRLAISCRKRGLYGNGRNQRSAGDGRE